MLEDRAYSGLHIMFDISLISISVFSVVLGLCAETN